MITQPEIKQNIEISMIRVRGLRKIDQLKWGILLKKDGPLFQIKNTIRLIIMSKNSIHARNYIRS